MPSQTNSLRLELSPRGIGVTGLHVGYLDTDTAAHVDAPKSSPRDVAALALAGVESGAYEVLADDVSRQVKAALSGDLAALHPQSADQVRRPGTLVPRVRRCTCRAAACGGSPSVKARPGSPGSRRFPATRTATR